jgi:hypothetical protein
MAAWENLLHGFRIRPRTFISGTFISGIHDATVCPVLAFIPADCVESLSMPKGVGYSCKYLLVTEPVFIMQAVYTVALLRCICEALSTCLDVVQVRKAKGSLI